MTRILIADDHAIVRVSLKQIVADSQSMTVSGQKAIEPLRQKDFDIVLLDIAMPGRGELDTLKTEGSRLHSSQTTGRLTMGNEYFFSRRF